MANEVKQEPTTNLGKSLKRVSTEISTTQKTSILNSKKYPSLKFELYQVKTLTTGISRISQRVVRGVPTTFI